jgi:hypothetical protein
MEVLARTRVILLPNLPAAMAPTVILAIMGRFA